MASNGVDLAQKKCVACEGGAEPMTPMEAMALLTHLKGWALAKDFKKISKQFKFKNFLEAMEFANKITPIAEAEGHHPDLEIGWGRVGIELTTHAIKGLSENDFILAAKIDKIA
ncbi:4a-hydroxytetrahydrobiopterin dehydratase [Candidatus Kaiserbacteria bacterium]|nr:4a-hydroxytetrahydrobiopterin dehydratase [Candidatus Kaiserbacteria bacterium]